MEVNVTSWATESDRKELPKIKKPRFNKPAAVKITIDEDDA